MGRGVAPEPAGEGAGGAAAAAASPAGAPAGRTGPELSSAGRCESARDMLGASRSGAPTLRPLAPRPNPAAAPGGGPAHGAGGAREADQGRDALARVGSGTWSWGRALGGGRV